MKSITLQNSASRWREDSGHGRWLDAARQASSLATRQVAQPTILLTRLLATLLLTLVMALPAAADQPAADAMQRASDLMDAKQYEQAAEAYEIIVREAQADSPLHAKAMYRWGVALQRIKRYEQAEANYVKALDSGNLSPAEAAEARMEAGYCDMMRRHHDQAAAWFEQVVTDPQASTYTISVSNLYAASNYVKLARSSEGEESDKYREAALACLVRVTQQADAHPHHKGTAWISMGKYYTELDQIEEARKAYQGALAVSETGINAARARTELKELDILAQPDSGLFMPPWVVSVSRDRATLHWIAKGDVAPASLVFEDDDVNTRIVKLEEIHPGYFLWRGDVTGLRGARHYKYIAKDALREVEASFFTPSGTADAVTFCVLGDTQSRATVSAKISQLIAKQNPRFVLHAGDCVERGNDFFQWQSQLIGPARPYLKMAPLYPARGNHDGGPYFPRLFNLIPDQHYSVDQGLVHAVFLDSFGPGARSDAMPGQAKWLDEVLAASTSPWKVVVVHDPMVNGDLTNAWWGLEHLMPVIEKHGVNVVFSGHHHRYRRFLPLHTPGKPEASPIWHITTGGAGGGLSGVVYTPLTVRTELIHHFIRVDASTTSMDMTVIDIDGNTLDKFSLSRDSQGYVRNAEEQPVDRQDAWQVIRFYAHLADTRHTPGVMMADWRDGRLVVDFDRLRQGVMPTDDLPSSFNVKIEAAQGSKWNVPSQTFSLRGKREMSIEATPPDGQIDSPLQLVFTPQLNGKTLISRQFNVKVNAPAQLTSQVGVKEVR